MADSDVCNRDNISDKKMLRKAANILKKHTKDSKIKDNT